MKRQRKHIKGSNTDKTAAKNQILTRAALECAVKVRMHSACIVDRIPVVGSSTIKFENFWSAS